MRKNDKSSNLLREFIEAVIAEEENNQLYQAFIQPFADVASTAAAGIEKLSAQTQTVVKGFLFGIPTLFVPFLEYDYETFREQEKAKVEVVRKKYEKVLQANLDAITSNDAFGVAFLLAPTTIMAAQLAVKAPEAALHVLEIFTGGSELLAGIRQALGGVSNVGFHDPGGHAVGAWQGGGGGGGDMGYGDSGGLYEATAPDKSAATAEIQKVLKDKGFVTKIENSPIAKKMKTDGIKLITDHVARFMALNDYNEMRKMAKGDKGFGQIGQQLSQMNQAGQVPSQDNPTVTAAMVPEIKKAYKEFWIKQLQQLLRQFPDAKTEILLGIKQLSVLH